MHSYLPAQADTTANDATRPSKAPNTNDLEIKIERYGAYIISLLRAHFMKSLQQGVQYGADFFSES
jgi:hypothetical protein